MAKFRFKLFVVLVNVICCVNCKNVGELVNLADYMNVNTLCNFNVTFDGETISEGCFEQLTESCNNEEVLATMIDASSKFPYTSLAKSTPRDYGGYDQCVEVDHNYQGGRILGKHCLFGLMLIDGLHVPISGMSADFLLFKGAFLLSVCMPNKCSAHDYNILFNNASINITYPDSKPFPGKFNEQRCMTKETGTDFSVLDCITILVFAACFALMIVCTAYDIYLKQTGKKPAHILFLSFSVYSNGKKLFQTSRGGNKEQILIFHGLKFISMLWIISGHGASIWQINSVINQDVYDQLPKKLEIMYLSSSVLAVDTFFFLAGFLAGWGYMKKKSLSLKSHILTTPLGYLHRYLRLTPALITILLVQLSIFGHFGSGPLWNLLFEEIQGKCEKNWWAVLLYIQNYYNKDDVCMLQSWYLSADMQLFLLSPIVLIPLAIALRNPRRLKISLFAMCILNIILTALPIVIKLSNEDYRNNYDTHSRLNTYFIGIMMGVFLHETKDRPFITNKWSKLTLKICNLVMWIIALLVMIAVVITQRTTEIDGRYESIVYQDAIKRPFWAAGLCWIVYSSYCGYGGFVNWFLTRPLMQIGGKLTYCIYLVHGLVIVYNVMVTRTRRHFSYYQWFYTWCGHFILATAIGFLWTLAFESPLITVERFIFRGGKVNKTQKSSQPPSPIKKEAGQNDHVSEENDKNGDIIVKVKQ